MCVCLFCRIHCLNTLAVFNRKCQNRVIKRFYPLFYGSNYIGSYLKWCHRGAAKWALLFGCHNSCRRKPNPGESFSQYFYPGPNRFLRSWTWASSFAHGFRFLMHSPVPLLEITSVKLAVCLLLQRCNFWHAQYRMKGALFIRGSQIFLPWMPIASQSFLTSGDCNKLSNPPMFLWWMSVLLW